jgi:hypothetical protein
MKTIVGSLSVGRLQYSFPGFPERKNHYRTVRESVQVCRGGIRQNPLKKNVARRMFPNERSRVRKGLIGFFDSVHVSGRDLSSGTGRRSPDLTGPCRMVAGRLAIIRQGYGRRDEESGIFFQNA